MLVSCICSDVHGALPGIKDALDFLILHEWLCRGRSVNPFAAADNNSRISAGAEVDSSSGQRSIPTLETFRELIQRGQLNTALQKWDVLVQIRPSWPETFSIRADILAGQPETSDEREFCLRLSQALQNVRDLRCSWNLNRLSAMKKDTHYRKACSGLDSGTRHPTPEHQCSGPSCKDCSFWEVRGWFLDWRRKERVSETASWCPKDGLWSRTVRDFCIRCLLVMKLAASPATWQFMYTKPVKGQELSRRISCNDRLSNALMLTQEFTKSQWERTGVVDLFASDYIRLGGGYLSPESWGPLSDDDWYKLEELPAKLKPEEKRETVPQLKSQNDRLKRNIEVLQERDGAQKMSLKLVKALAARYLRQTKRMKLETQQQQPSHCVSRAREKMVKINLDTFNEVRTVVLGLIEQRPQVQSTIVQQVRS